MPVPIRVFRECSCSVGGFTEHEWTGLCDRHPKPNAVLVNGARESLDPIWAKATWLTKITKAVYDYMLADSAWCDKHAPGDPKATPTRAVDLNKAKPIF